MGGLARRTLKGKVTAFDSAVQSVRPGADRELFPFSKLGSTGTSAQRQKICVRRRLNRPTSSSGATLARWAPRRRSAWPATPCTPEVMVRMNVVWYHGCPNAVLILKPVPSSNVGLAKVLGRSDGHRHASVSLVPRATRAHRQARRRPLCPGAPAGDGEAGPDDESKQTTASQQSGLTAGAIVGVAYSGAGRLLFCAATTLPG